MVAEIGTIFYYKHHNNNKQIIILKSIWNFMEPHKLKKTNDRSMSLVFETGFILVINEITRSFLAVAKHLLCNRTADR